MALDGLRVDHSGLDRTAEDLLGIVQRIEDRLHALDAGLSPLRTSWAGEAQQAYVVAKARWDGAIDEMRDLLRSTARQVSASNAAYAAADARAARSFGS